MRTALVLVAAGLFGAPQDDSLALTLRKRQETAPGSGRWHTLPSSAAWPAKKTAVILCDMWDRHWCAGATRRVGQMAPRMQEVVAGLRKKGALVIHCPSDTMGFYKDTPQRKLAQDAPKVETKIPLERWRKLDPAREGALPIDDSDGGCDCEPQCKNGKAWSRQIDVLKVEEGDAVTDSAEAYHLMRQKGIENVLVMGVHTNMCVLGRPFSIRQLVLQGLNVVLVRDMTDTMYNPRKAPLVSHFTGTDLVIEHIEKYWCATTTSDSLAGGKPFRFPGDERPHLVMLIAEDEYKTEETLPPFALKHLGKEFRVTSVFEKADDKNNLPGLEILEEADAVLVSMRRRVLPEKQMAAIKKFVAAGKPIIGIRTASHAFTLREGRPPAGLADWPEFDAQVLGGNYQGHHGEGGSFVRTAPAASGHVYLRGVPDKEFKVAGSLYKTSPLKEGAGVLQVGRVEGNAKEEPVTWTYSRSDGGRTFYTSLGHPDDFKIDAVTRVLANGIRWAAGLGADGNPIRKSGSLSPSDALKKFTVNDDLRLQQVLAEPQVAQPVFINFDERGRMWVVQYLQYPFPAGLKVISKDKFYRAVYDKVPPAPPNHVRGADKITIHEDTDGDGVYDRHKTFIDGLNIVTAVERGRGGVWVLNPPYLLFYPDRDGDDVPDGDPVVHLEGFGLEDTHSCTNSLRWGPDGWLYASQGSTVSGHIRRPGLDKAPIAETMGQLIWRYHPETKRYEVFSEGGGNAFGVEFDAKGRIYSGHNGGDTRGFHYAQGAYLQKGFDKHGELSNPYAFGYFPAMKSHNVPRFTHNFVIYEGAALPERYRGRLFGIAPLQSEVILAEFQPDRSSFKTYDLGKPVTSGDPWFRPVDIKVGPDGAVYVADFYDGQIAHRQHYEGVLDVSNGRIYRLTAAAAAPLKPFDLSRKSTGELIETLAHPNKWFRQTALRLMADRRDPAAVPLLQTKVASSEGQDALEALWALYLSGGAPAFLDHKDAQVRLWSVRLLCDERKVSTEVAKRLAAMAATEPDLEARGQLASSARRLPAADGLPIVRALLGHDEDADDPRQPLLLWWAIESKADSDAPAILALLEDKVVWDRTIVKKHLLERLMRRWAAPDGGKGLAFCAKLLRLSPGSDQTAALMTGFEKAFQGRSLRRLPDDLVEAMAKGGGSIVLGLRRGLAEAVKDAIGIVSDEKADRKLRLQVVQAFGEVSHPGSVRPLLEAARGTKDEELRRAALTALQRYDDPAIGADVVKLYPGLSADARAVARSLLASRRAWSLALLEAMDSGALDPKSVPDDVARRILLHGDARLGTLVRKHWGEVAGATSAQMQKEMERILAAVRGGSGDPYSGKRLFANSCFKCHLLFEKGGRIGPDLTSYQRGDLEALVRNIVNPNAEIREGFENHLVLTKDGRSVNGFLVERDAQVLVLRGADGQNLVLPQSEIDRQKVSEMSLMPEGLLKDLTDAQLRDFFAYLRSSQPLND